MSGLVKKKVGHYLAARDELETKYASLISQADPSIKNELCNLQEFDFLNHSYIALKSYYEISKCKWDLDYRNLLDDLASVNARIEAKLSIRELCNRIPELSVLRRELRERAREAGRISHLMITSSANLEELASIVNEIPLPPTKHSTKESVDKNQKVSAKLNKKANSAIQQSHTPKNVPQTQSALSNTVSQNKELGPQPSKKNLSASGKLDSPQTPSLSESDGKQHRSSSILDIPIQIEAFNAQNSNENLALPSVEPEGTLKVNEPPTQIKTNIQTASNDQTKLPKQVTTEENAIQSTTSNKKRSSDEPGLSHPAHKRPQVECTFAKMRTWTREHVRCIVSGAYNNNNPVEAIMKAFKKKFKLKLTAEEVDTLRLHYGLMEPYMKGYRYNIQSFHAVASYFYDNMVNYVIIPWTDMRLQYARKTKISIPDWEIKNRYYLFLLHRKVYGKVGEPASNYHDLVSAFHKINGRLANSKLPSPILDSDTTAYSSKTVFDPNTGSSNLTLLKSSLSYSDSNPFDKWTPKDVEALIEAEHKVPATVNYRSSVIMHYIKLKTDHTFTLDEILWRRCQDDVLIAIQKRATTNKARTTEKFSDKNNKVGSNNNKILQADGQKQSSPMIPSQPASNQFDVLLENIATETREDSYYLRKIPGKIIMDFWDFDKTKSLVSTIEYISLIDPQTKDVTLRVARLNMIKIAMLRLLRDYQVKILAELIENRLKRMMEMDVFDEALCRVINEHLHKLPL